MKSWGISLAFLFCVAPGACALDRELATTQTLTNPLAEGETERKSACEELQEAMAARGCTGPASTPRDCYPAAVLYSAYCYVPEPPDPSLGANAEFCLGALDLAKATAPFECRRRSAPFLSCVARTIPEDTFTQDPMRDCAEYWMGPECEERPSMPPEQTPDSVAAQCRGGGMGFGERTPDDPEVRAQLVAEGQPVYERDQLNFHLDLCADSIPRKANCELMDDCTWVCSCYEGETKTLEQRLMLTSSDHFQLYEVCGWLKRAPTR